MQLREPRRNRWRELPAVAKLALPAGLLLVVCAGLLTYNTGGTSWLNWQWQRAQLHEHMAEFGNGALDYPEQSLTRLFTTLPQRWLGSVAGGSAEPPLLMLDIKFKHMRKIYERREQALERGVLIQQADDFIPGSLRIAQRTVPIRMRLKGDWTDHLEGNKWSFRIHTRRGNQVMGMRRFSLQHPRVRGYHSEALYLDLLRENGVLAPRYLFVKAMLNGNDLGIMALEEHFSKELLESQSRREGVIVRFDESLVWDATDGTPGEGENASPRGFNGIYDDYRNAPLDAFRGSKIAESPTLTAHYQTAVGLLRAFVAGRLPASEVFDPQTLGTYLAVTEFTGTRHPGRWHNQRFYLNPITLKLEPIGFDADLQNRIAVDKLVSTYEPLVQQMLADSRVRSVFEGTLQRLLDDALNGELLETTGARQEQLLAALRAEFYLLQPFPMDYLHSRAGHLNNTLRQDPQSLYTPDYPQFTGRKPPHHYPAPLHAWLVEQDGQRKVEVSSAIPWPVQIHKMVATPLPEPTLAQLSAQDSHAPAVETELSAALPARQMFAPPLLQELSGPVPPNTTVELSGAILADQERVPFTVTAAPLPPVLVHHPLPRSTLEEQLRAHPFLKQTAPGRLQIRAGDWTVQQHLIIPAGVTLHAGPATRLQFAPHTGLFSYGPLQFHGTEAAPVTLMPDKSTNSAEQTWLGIAVMEAGGDSRWSHVSIEDTRGVHIPPWKLMGGINFYQSPVQISNSRFSGHTGEDALNIISTDFTLTDSHISGAASDGFDCDFCTGTVAGGSYTEIAGDGLDFSLSTIRVEGTTFSGIADKALSVGEGSTVTASNLKISSGGTGVAAKDGSRLDLQDSQIESTKVAALMAYVKKPEFGPATILANNISLQQNRVAAVVQTDNHLNLNGRDVPTEDVDVDKLYDTVMRPSVAK